MCANKQFLCKHVHFSIDRSRKSKLLLLAFQIITNLANGIKWQKNLRYFITPEGSNLHWILLMKVQRSIFNLRFSPNTHAHTHACTYAHTHTCLQTHCYLRSWSNNIIPFLRIGSDFCWGVVKSVKWWRRITWWPIWSCAWEQLGCYALLAGCPLLPWLFSILP